MIYVGVDVSKRTVDASVRLGVEGPEVKKLPHRKFPNSELGAKSLVDWVRSLPRCKAAKLRVVVEATGVYHRRIVAAWYALKCEVVVANPKRVRDFVKGLGLLNKTDKADSRGIAYYAQHGKTYPWHPTPRNVAELRALLSRLTAIDKETRRESNRQEKAGCDDTPAPVLASIARTLSHLKAEYKHLLADIEAHYRAHPSLSADRDLLLTIPAVGALTASHLITLLRSRTFQTARQAAAMSGLVPVQFESGESIKGETHISKNGPKRTRVLLYLCAVSGTRFNAPLAAIYRQLKARRKTAKSALNAMARRLVHIAFGILKHRSAFNPALVGIGKYPRLGVPRRARRRRSTSPVSRDKAPRTQKRQLTPQRRRRA